VSHARKIVRQMLDTLESAALYIIFIPHALVCLDTLCGKIGRETQYGICRTPCACSLSDFCTIGNGRRHQRYRIRPRDTRTICRPAWRARTPPAGRSSVSVPSSPLTWGRVRGGPSLRKCQLKHSFLQAEQIEAAGLGQKTKGHFRLLKWPSASRQRSERLHTR